MLPELTRAVERHRVARVIPRADPETALRETLDDSAGAPRRCAAVAGRDPGCAGPHPVVVEDPSSVRNSDERGSVPLNSTVSSSRRLPAVPSERVS